MITLRCSELFLLLLATNLAYSAEHSTNTVASILQSYANTFTTLGPNGDNRPVSSIQHPVSANYPRFTTIRPNEQRVVEVTAQPSNFVENRANVHSADSSSEESDEDPEGPPDHVIPHSEHENPREPSTRPNYTAPGNWAKPPPDKNIPLEFVPTKLYAQVRGTHTVAHLPREEAVNSAQTDEEKENAARLKEVVKISKANTVYTEEGYEDAAYDHAGQIRDADFHEGFARKLNQELDRQKGLAGNGDRPRKKSSKKRNKKPRKSKARQYDYDDDYRDHLEVIEEARTNKQRIRPEDLKVLKAALEDSVVNPKNIVEDGILRLEEDLRKEAYEAQRTSTEPYATTTAAPPVEVVSRSNEIQQETTTARHDIFTVRPRRIPTAVKPKTYLAKVKIPSQYYSPKTSDYVNNGEFATEDYSSISPYSLIDHNQNPAVGYQPIYLESQTVSPLVSNPLALATVNGHGPYLFLVTSPPDPFTLRSLENQELTTPSSTQYIASTVNNATSTGLTNSFVQHRPLLVTDRKSEITSGEKHSPQYIHNNPQVEESPIDSHYKPPKKFKTLLNHEKMLDYLKNEKNGYLDYYTALQPPKPNSAVITYSDYPRGSYGNVLNQWSMPQKSARPLESTYSALPKPSHPQIDANLQRASQPVTRLLPPSPLSASEYASFYQRNTRAESTTPSLMTIMPIIQAIHKYEHGKQQAFPFLLRKKRSALGPTREWEIMQRDLKLQQAERPEKQQARLANAGSAIDEKKISTKKFPQKFERLLHQSPRVAEDVVDKEIRQRFKQSSEESSSEESKEELKESLKENVSVEVEVPELNFSDLFKEDEREPTTKKPGIDVKKYPFYKSDEVAGNIALKYIINPLDVPEKTLGGMEFYESRNLECDEIDPNLEKIVPEEEDLENKRGPRKNKPRLHGLGDKLDCYKAKYFDENPLDNPIFFEKQVEIPSVPKELDARKFASRILELPPEKDEYVIQKGPKHPEQFRPTRKKVKQRNIPNYHFSEQNMNYNYAPRWKNTAYMNNRRPQRQRPPPKTMFTNESKIRSNKTRSRTGTKKPNLRVTPPYQRQVYEDVMGTIMNIENMYKSPGSKRSTLSSFSKSHNRENHKNKENKEFNRQKKRKSAEIEGLVPPPLENPALQKSNKRGSPKQRIRNNYTDGSLQRFKRSVDVEDKNKHSINLTNVNNISNNTNEIKKKSPFRIILTTPAPVQIRPTRQTVTIVKDEPTTTTERIIYTINDRIRHSYRNREDPGRFNKFENQENGTSSIDLRRKEPRYNDSYKRNSVKVPSSNLTSNISVNESSLVTPVPPIDPHFSASTIIPVIVKPDENFTARVPQESKAAYQKQKLEDKVKEEPEQENLESREESENSKENPTKDSKKPYSVHENIKEDDKNVEKTTEITDDGDKVEIITKYSSLPDSKEHKELYEFLKGDPPGYDKEFPPDDSSPERLESKKEESVHIADSKEVDHRSKEDPIDEEIEELDENENQNENENEDERENDNEKENDEHVAESTSENPEIETNENSEPATEEEENSNKNSKESDEPFVRYSSRPYSPPENFEDELYSDLGPRVNKPYFYHPPFEVPEYEKRILGKSIDRADNGDWEHNEEETEDHETYIFPWQADEEEKNEGDESQHYSRYEYPWEKRERKEREKRKQEKLKKLHNKMYGHEDESGPDEEESVTRLVYVPLRKRYPRYYSYIVPRGKKDIKPVKRSSEQRPVTKFSSRYKSGVIKVPLDDEEMLITVANNDAIKQSIMNYLHKAVSTTPKSKSVQDLQKNVTGAANNVNTITFSSNKTTRAKIENTMLKPPVNLTNPVIENIVNSTTVPVSTTSSPRQARMRSRKAKVAASSETIINLQTTTTPPSRVMRRRGRSRSATTSTTPSSTTVASTKPNRRRSRLSTVSTTTSTTVSSTSKTLNDRRRRPSRSQMHVEQTEKIPEVKKNDQSSSTTLSSTPAATGKTIEHHSRISKEEIITKTITNEDDSDEDITDEDVSKSDNTKLASEKAPLVYSKISRRNKPKNDTDEHTVKEKVEKVTITMEETPNHVFKTEEIDKDGVKGKFVTITANNNTTPSRDRNNSFQVNDDHDVEEVKKRINDFNSFESVIQDSEEPSEDSSSNQEAEANNNIESNEPFQNYLVGNLLQKSSVPIDRKSNGQEAESSVEDDSSEDADEDYRDDDYHENDNDDDDNDEIEEEETNDNEGEKSGAPDTKNVEENKKDTDNEKQKPSILIIKDPDSRRYFYIEQR